MAFTIPTEIPDALRRELIAAAQRRWDTRGYLAKLGDALSQLGNALLGGAPDESLSGRSYRIAVLADDDGPIFWELVGFIAEWIFFWQDGNHCQLAFWEDIYRARSRAAVANDIADAVALHTFGPGDSLRDDSPDQNEEP